MDVGRRWQHTTGRGLPVVAIPGIPRPVLLSRAGLRGPLDLGAPVPGRVGILASLLFAVHHEAGDAFALQNHKFPVGPVYLVASLLSVTAVLWMKGYEGVLSWFGQRTTSGRV